MIHRIIFPVFLAFSFLTPSILSAADSLPKKGICSHRGANSTHPENTIPAFREAVRLGAAQIELDVCRSRDGYLVIMHDPTVDRTTDGTGKIADMTFEEIRRLDAGIKKDPEFAGTKVPTLEEVLDVIPPNTWINLHLKDNLTAADVARLLIEKKRTNQAFLACGRNAALAAKEVSPEIKICNMERFGKDVSKYIAKTIEWNSEFIQLAYEVGTPEEMKRLKEAGIRINFFGVRSLEHFRQLVEAGVEFPLIDNYTQYLPLAIELGLIEKGTVLN